MAGPKVVGGRPDPAAAGGEFTKAFGNVLDAIQAGRQAAALEEQIRAGERAKYAELVGGFFAKTLERRSADVGESQAASELSDDIGNWLTSLGFDGKAYASRAKETYTAGKESPTRLAMRDMSMFLANPGQLPSIMKGISTEEPAPAAESGNISETGEPPSESPALPMKGALTTPIGPDTPEKRTTITEALSAAQQAAEGDYTALEGLLAKRKAVDRVVKAQEAGSTQAQRDAYSENYLKQPEVAAKYQWLFGPTWKEDWADIAFGTREKRIEAESRMMSAQAAVDKETLALVIAAVKESGETKRQQIMATAMLGVAETNRRGGVEEKGIDQETALLRENDEAIQNSWKEIGDLFNKMGEPQARQSQKYKELLNDISRREKLKPANRDKAIGLIYETLDEPGTAAAIMRFLKLGGTVQVPALRVTPKGDEQPPTAPAAPSNPVPPSAPISPGVIPRGAPRQPSENQMQYLNRLQREGSTRK